MKDIRAIKGRYHILRLIEEGEHVCQDFKFAISDARKIARSISAFANNGGGRLLVGVKDNGTVAGVRSEEDIFVVEQAAQMYCRPPQHIDVTAYRINPGQIVYKVEIAPCQQRPVMVVEEGGKMKAYFRVEDENIAVPRLLEQAWRGDDGSGGVLLRLDGNSGEILACIREAAPEGVTPANLVVRTHLAATTVEAELKRMYRMGIIDFRFAPSREFVVVIAVPDAETKN